jgi:chromosomal replication initiation ATPase DnaA
MPQARDHRQLALEFPLVEGSALGDFEAVATNEAALAAVLAWPRWPSVALILDGPEGSGKTHLARIWAQRAEARQLAAAEIWSIADPLQRLGAAHAAVVEDADHVADETILLHLYNLLAERHGHLLLTSRRPLAAWPFRLPDLRSRLATAWMVHIDPPDDALLAAVLVKQLTDRQLPVEGEVVRYLLARMERSFAAVRRLVEALDRASLCARRPVGLHLARSVLLRMRTRDEEASGRQAGGVRPSGADLG